MFDTQRIEHDAPVLVELKQRAEGSVRGWVGRKSRDIVLSDPGEFFDGNILTGRRGVAGH
jgi:hypothetical protein